MVSTGNGVIVWGSVQWVKFKDVKDSEAWEGLAEGDFSLDLGLIQAQNSQSMGSSSGWFGCSEVGFFNTLNYWSIFTSQKVGHVDITTIFSEAGSIINEVILPKMFELGFI